MNLIRSIRSKRKLSFSFCILLALFLSFSCSNSICLDEDDNSVAKTLIVVDSCLHSSSKYFVVYGDLQAYTVSTKNVPFYQKSLFWIRDQFDAGVAICSVLAVGDVTENNLPEEWSLFKVVSDTVSSRIPFYVCAGNHDYSWDSSSRIHDRSSSLINEFASFPLSKETIVDYFTTDDLSNYVARINGIEDLNLLVLEFGPRQEVIDWANDYVSRNKDQSFILMTHEWLTRYGERVSVHSYAERHFKDYSSYSTPEEIWLKLVRSNDNILCVLCGHNGFAAKLFSENIVGRQVPQILFNLQYQENGGNGLIQLWEFPAASDSVRICAYDTINHKWHLPDSTSITFKYKHFDLCKQ